MIDYDSSYADGQAPRLKSLRALQQVPRGFRGYVVDGLLARLEGLQGTEETVALVEDLHREMVAVHGEEDR